MPSLCLVEIVVSLQPEKYKLRSREPPKSIHSLKLVEIGVWATSVVNRECGPKTFLSDKRNPTLEDRWGK